MRLQKRVILGAVFFLVLAWLCTGGMVVFRHWFNPRRSFQQEFKPYILAEVKVHDSVYGVPFLFQYFGDRTPFGISLTYVTHNVVKEGRILIDEATIRFQDGTATDIVRPIQTGLILRPEEHWYIDEAHVNLKQPSLRGEVTVNDCLPARTPFMLSIRGRMVSEGLPVETFDVEWKFEPQYETDIFSTWRWLAASGI